MIAAGQTVGNYRILNKIGTGGMGAVYLAEHPLIGKRVALKVIHRELAGNRDVVSRFFQEARAVNKIGNEHIVEIHDFGVTPEGDHFFIMEYLEGRTLASILSREIALDVMRSLHIGAQIAAALAAAHAAGIIHRDLKPDNIMLMARLGEDFVKVLDFGLAKVFSAATAVKTAAGVLLGTPQYMSPEACESKGDVDHRTDIYALGVLLFQMMTGVLPFDGNSMGEVLVKHVTTLPPAPRAINPSIPPSVEQILLRCLAKPVDARFATMMQLRDALLDPEAYLRGSPPIAPARSVGSRGLVLGEAQTEMLHIAPPRQSTAPSQMPTRIAELPAAQQNTRIAPANPLPLPAPAPSLSGAASQPTLIAGHEPVTGKRAAVGMPPHELKMNTMRIATPVGYSSRAPRKVWPIVMLIAVFLGLGSGVLSVVCFGRAGDADKPADTSSASEGTGSTSAASTGASLAAADGPSAGASGADVSDARVSDAAASTTSAMSGSGSAAGSGAVGSGSTGAVGSGAVGSGAVGTGAGGSGAATPGLIASGSGASSAGAPLPPMITARLSIDSVPSGAAVTGPDGTALGKTPLKIDWPISDLPVAFELRLAGYKRKVKQTVVNGNTALRIELDRVAAVRRPGTGTGSGSAKRGNRDNGLMRPDD